MQVYYRSKSSYCYLVLFLITSLLNITRHLHHKNVFFLCVWLLLGLAFAALMIVYRYKPFIIIDSTTMKLAQNPFVTREYQLSRLKLIRKKSDLIHLIYQKDNGKQETIKLYQYLLDKGDFANLAALLDKDEPDLTMPDEQP